MAAAADVQAAAEAAAAADVAAEAAAAAVGAAAAAAAAAAAVGVEAAAGSGVWGRPGPGRDPGVRGSDSGPCRAAASGSREGRRGRRLLRAGGSRHRHRRDSGTDLETCLWSKGGRGRSGEVAQGMWMPPCFAQNGG